MSKKYQVFVYQGVYWLKDAGVFDTFDEASDAMQEECAAYCEDSENENDRLASEECFYFNSRIEEIDE